MPYEDRKRNITKKEKKEYKYKLTSAGRKDVRQRAKSEAGLAAEPKKKFKLRSKLARAITGQRYKIPKVGSGTRLGKERKMVKPRKFQEVDAVAVKHDPEKGEIGRSKPHAAKTKEELKTAEARARKGAGIEERKAALKKKKAGGVGEREFKSNIEAQKKDKKEKVVYEEGSRTREQLIKDRDLKRKLKNLIAEKGERRGKQAMKRQRKKVYKEEYKTTGYLQ